jgi:hypothetical protein
MRLEKNDDSENILFFDFCMEMGVAQKHGLSFMWGEAFDRCSKQIYCDKLATMRGM